LLLLLLVDKSLLCLISLFLFPTISGKLAVSGLLAIFVLANSAGVPFGYYTYEGTIPLL